MLDLATRGVLDTHDASDGNARDLLGERVSSRVGEFDIPSTWAWTTIELLGEVRGGGTPSKTNGNLWGGKIPWVSPKDMKVAHISDAQDHVTPAALDESAAKLIPAGSLLMVVRGMILAHSFPVALTVVDVTINQDMKALLPFAPELRPYLLTLLQASRDRVLALVERSTHGTCKLPYEALAALPLPIPPLAEQTRIVARVDELSKIVDRLALKRSHRDDLHRAWAASVVAHVDLDAATGRL